MTGKNFRVVIIVLLIVAAGIWACNKDSDSSIPDTQSNVNVFVVNPDASYDVVLDTTTLGSSLVQGDNTGYKSFEAKRYTLYIYAAGERTTPLIQGQISLRNKHNYSVFFMKNHNNVLQVLIAEDQLGASSQSVGYLRVVNLSDSYNSNNGALTLDFDVDGAELFASIGYGAVSAFKEVTLGTHKRDILYADSSLSLLYNNIDTFNIAAGKSYSWILYGNAFVADSFKVATFQHN